MLVLQPLVRVAGDALDLRGVRLDEVLEALRLLLRGVLADHLVVQVVLELLLRRVPLAAERNLGVLTRLGALVQQLLPRLARGPVSACDVLGHGHHQHALALLGREARRQVELGRVDAALNVLDRLRQRPPHLHSRRTP